MWRRMQNATLGLAALLLIGTAGCVDLAVQNPNAPDAERALATPGDVESLIAGSWGRWHRALWYDAFTMFRSAQSFEHGAPWANAGVEQFGRIPRIPLFMSPGNPDVGYLTYGWTTVYRAVAAVADGLREIEAGTVDLGASGNARAKAYGKFVQGLAHGTIALMYDSGFVYDETRPAADTTVPLVGHEEIMAAALGYLQEAADLASGASFTIPSTWMSTATDAATLARLAHSTMASFRANVARTPAERLAVDWDAVVADANAGVIEDWDLMTDGISFYDDALGYRSYPGWNMTPMWVIGMADQSGAYQSWIATPTGSKQPFLMVTTDDRFPQGDNEDDQIANPGTLFQYAQGDADLIGSRPDRGTWRWSHYRDWWLDDWNYDGVGPVPLVTVREMDALRAEAAYYDGNLAAVVAYINPSRTAHGLNATDVAGTNTSCVPKLPNGACGDLWEMFKWEKRMETQYEGPLRIGWFLDGRGWGDLMEGTALDISVPFVEMQLRGRNPYSLGGVGGIDAAPVGTYGY